MMVVMLMVVMVVAVLTIVMAADSVAAYYTRSKIHFRQNLSADKNHT